MTSGSLHFCAALAIKPGAFIPATNFVEVQRRSEGQADSRALISAHDETRVSELALEADAAIYLCKSFDDGALLKAVCRAISLTHHPSSRSEATIRRTTYLAALLSSTAAGVWFAFQSFDSHQYYFFSRMIVIDSFASVMKAVVSLGFAVSLVYSRRYLEDRDLFRDDVFLLGMFSLLGQLIMISGNHFLMLYLGLELMSLSLYAMIALRRDAAQSSEAAMKYYVLGALATGFLLYGISMLYGATGSLELNEVLKAVASGRINDALLLFGVIFIVAGVAFKMGAVPFHMWVPDVYHGAPTAMTLFVGGGPKVAASFRVR